MFSSIHSNLGIARRVHICETPIFARLICFPFERPSMGDQTFRPSAFFLLMVPCAGGAFPSTESSPNALSLDLSFGQYSLRSNTV